MFGGGLIADAAGNLYGTTSQYGATSLYNVGGTAFEIAKTPGGYANAPATLCAFNGITNRANGYGLSSTLMTDAAGDLFGTAGGGTYNHGTVFELAKTSGGYTLSILASFNGANGNTPSSGLVADAAGDRFGTTAFGGAYGDGTVFEIAKTNGVYASTPTTLVNFDGTNGAFPADSLIADAAGDLFGTTVFGGAYGDGELSGNGTVFEITNSGL